MRVESEWKVDDEYMLGRIQSFVRNRAGDRLYLDDLCKLEGMINNHAIVWSEPEPESGNVFMANKVKTKSFGGLLVGGAS